MTDCRISRRASGTHPSAASPRRGGSVRGSPCGEPARLRFTSLRPPSCGDFAGPSVSLKRPETRLFPEHLPKLVVMPHQDIQVILLPGDEVGEDLFRPGVAGRRFSQGNELSDRAFLQRHPDGERRHLTLHLAALLHEVVGEQGTFELPERLLRGRGPSEFHPFSLGHPLHLVHDRRAVALLLLHQELVHLTDRVTSSAPRRHPIELRAVDLVAQRLLQPLHDGVLPRLRRTLFHLGGSSSCIKMVSLCRISSATYSSRSERTPTGRGSRKPRSGSRNRSRS